VQGRAEGHRTFGRILTEVPAVSHEILEGLFDLLLAPALGGLCVETPLLVRHLTGTPATKVGKRAGGVRVIALGTPKGRLSGILGPFACVNFDYFFELI
jgi:hypothetical protein